MMVCYHDRSQGLDFSLDVATALLSSMSSTFNEEPNSSWLNPSSGSADVEGINLVQARLENQALRDQIAAQTHLIQLLTHQLATPLTSLSGSIQLLSELDLTPEQRQEFLEVVQQQVQRLQNLLQDLITIRDVETGEVQTRPIEFSIQALMDEVIAAFQSCPAVYQFSPDLPKVWGDRWQVSQVLVNLLSNAVKYSPNDSPIEVGAARLPSGWVEVWVRDHGLGIPLADQPRLFERFYRVKHGDRQHIQGTGLGLSLCKLLVENQGGQLGVDSTHGEGSRFYFTLPTHSVASTAKGFAD